MSHSSPLESNVSLVYLMLMFYFFIKNYRTKSVTICPLSEKNHPRSKRKKKIQPVLKRLTWNKRTVWNKKKRIKKTERNLACCECVPFFLFPAFLKKYAKNKINYNKAHSYVKGTHGQRLTCFQTISCIFVYTRRCSSFHCATIQEQHINIAD